VRSASAANTVSSSSSEYLTIRFSIARRGILVKREKRQNRLAEVD
jgi:hypothetical protein